ncbi:thiol reductant ABC exporter subunit CydC [Gracilibacillus phocaeensis]|uniref:thiol reductant ABC exporter subunit CydC n=1 Tax=Gracilibacillus phocaeensis TaxID=2042304 RepID=UPI0010326157|nr:thiol reductant ABC exporter subunit CydC [Gracilibacillus phocaeensis]
MKDVAIVLRMLLKEKKDVLLSILFGFIAGMTAVGLFSASGYLISQAALAPPIYTLIVIVALVKLLGITSAVSRYGERYVSHRGTFTMLKNIRVYVYDRIEPIADRLLQRYRSGDILARIVGDVESLQYFFLRVFYPPIVLVTVMLTTILFTTIFSIKIAITMVIGMVVLVLFIPACFYLQEKKRASKVRESRGALSAEFTEYLYGFQELTIYQQADEKEQQLLAAMKEYEAEKLSENRRHAFQETVMIFLAFFLAVIVLVQASFYVTEGSLSGVLLAMLFMIALTAFEDAPMMATFPAYLDQSRQASQRLIEVWSGEEAASSTPAKQMAQQEALAFQFDQVSLQYLDQPTSFVKEISLDIPAGSKVAIVGASGSGKSTLMQAMLGFLPVTSGCLSVQQTPIETWEKESLWRIMNVSLQQNHFFYGSVGDNLALANPSATEDNLRVALNKATLSHLALDDLVQESGANLSGGEKQRLALARLFLHPADTWLLDEPTSSLDAITEQQVMQQVYQHAADATIVMIRHRLTGLEQMDQIVVMDHGEVVEQGTYQELMKQTDGYFRKMKRLEEEQLRFS